MLLLPCGCGDGAVGVHDDLGAADDHHDQEEAEEDEASQRQTLVHVDKGRLGRGLSHCAAVAVGFSSGSDWPSTIFYSCWLEQSPLHKDPGSGGSGREGRWPDITASSRWTQCGLPPGSSTAGKAGWNTKE